MSGAVLSGEISWSLRSLIIGCKDIEPDLLRLLIVAFSNEYLLEFSKSRSTAPSIFLREKPKSETRNTQPSTSQPLSGKWGCAAFM